MKKLYCVFDIGGTKTRLGVSSDGKYIDRCLIASTPRNYRAGMEAVCRLRRQLIDGNQIRGVAGGVAGTFNKTKSRTLHCPQLPAWVGQPLKRDLAKIFHQPVALENDAALGGLGEAMVGASRRAGVVGYITVGTEVGGSRITNGQIDQTAFGFEPGQQMFLRRGRWQTWEQIIGGRGISRQYKLKPEEIADSKIWRELGEYLAMGLRNAVALWSPDVLVLGGSVMNKLWPVRVGPRISSGLIWPPIKRGRLGDRATMMGALVHLRLGPRAKQ